MNMKELKVEIKWLFQKCSNLFSFFVWNTVFCPDNTYFHHVLIEKEAALKTLKWHVKKWRKSDASKLSKSSFRATIGPDVITATSDHRKSRIISHTVYVRTWCDNTSHWSYSITSLTISNTWAMLFDFILYSSIGVRLLRWTIRANKSE